MEAAAAKAGAVPPSDIHPPIRDDGRGSVQEMPKAAEREAELQPGGMAPFGPRF